MITKKSNIVVSDVIIKKNNFTRLPSNKCGTVVLTANEIKRLLGDRISGMKILEDCKPNYPRYYYGHIDRACQDTGACNSNSVGKMHEFFGRRKFRSKNEWIKWYEKNYPDTIQKAVNKIWENIVEFGIDRKKHRRYKPHIKNFVRHLVLHKTYTGLKIQEAILVKLAELKRSDYKWSSSKQDSQGTDGFVGNIPITVKPDTCKYKKHPGVKRINYTINKQRTALSFTFSI